jgi:hypothetical protein
MTHPFKPGQTIDAYLAEHGGGDGALSGLSITTLEFLADGGDQNAIAELDRRAAAGGGDTISTDPATGKIIVRNAAGEIVSVSNPIPSTGGDGTAPSFSSTRAAADLAFQQAQQLAQEQFDRDQTTLAQRHQNDLAILQRELESATGLQRERIQAEIDLENLRHDNDLIELREQFENQLKQTVIGEIGAERRTRIQEQGALKRELLNLGPDPFLQSFNLSGQVARGITPQQTAVGQAQQFINQPLPNIDFNATLPQLQSQLGTIQGTQAPTLQGGFGLPSLAHGGVVTGAGQIAPRGVIEMQRGSDGAFSRVPAIVGDEGPELALLPPGSEIIPLSKLQGMDLTRIPRAQGGLRVPDPFLNPNLANLQALAPLFGQAGPTFARPAGGIAGRMGEISVTNFGALSGLGVTPQFVREIETGRVLFIQNGVRRYVGSPEALGAFGVNPSNIIDALASEIARIAPTQGPVINNVSGFPGPQAGPAPAFQGLGTPLIEATTGAILPAPFKIARQLGQFQRERPDLFANALSAFKNIRDPVTGLPTAGFSPQSVLAQIQAATPTGRFTRPQRIGFQGTRI